MPGSGGGSWEGRASLATGWGLRDPTPGRGAPPPEGGQPGTGPSPQPRHPHDQHTCLDLPSGELPGGSRTAHGTSALVIPQGQARLPRQGRLTAGLSSGLGVFAQGRHTHPLVATAWSPNTTLTFYNPAHAASLYGWELQPGEGAQPGSGTGGQVPTRPGQAATADPGCSGPGRAPQAQTARWPQTFLPVQCLLRTPQPTVHVTAVLPTAGPAPPGPAGTTVGWYERKSSGSQEHEVTGLQTA